MNFEPKDNRRPNPFRQPIADPDETWFRHCNWQRTRDLVRAALVRTGHSTQVLDRWDNCGAECLVEWSESEGRYRLSGSYCHSRHCRPCMKAKGDLIALNLKSKLEADPLKPGDDYRFITLTWKHESRPLVDQLKSLRQAFAELRQHPIWKDSQRGGAVMLECHANERNEWHPHLHVMSEGQFIHQRELADAWFKISGGSFKVTVQKIAGPKDVGFYVAKYVTKGTKDDVWDDPALADEWTLATKGLRTCATYGTWRGFRLLKHDKTDDATDWKPVGLLSRIIAAAYAGSLADQNLLTGLMLTRQYDPSRRRQKRDTTTGST